MCLTLKYKQFILKVTASTPPQIVLPPGIRTVVKDSPGVRSSSPSFNKRPASSTDFNAEIDLAINKKMKMANDLVELDSYYYSNLQGDIQVFKFILLCRVLLKSTFLKKKIFFLQLLFSYVGLGINNY